MSFRRLALPSLVWDISCRSVISSGHADTESEANETGAGGRIAATKTISVLVLGLGNVLLAEDGVGAAALARLERDYAVPPEVKLADGASGFAAAPSPWR